MELLGKMVVQYFVPNQVIEKFKERGKELAFLAGHKDGDCVTVSHIIFPNQHEFRLDSEYGKYVYQSIFLNFL